MNNLLLKKIESICIFGDSTAWGAWDLEKGGWVNRLWFYVAKRKEDYVEIYNQSISGGTTKTILKRFESEAKIRNADAIIFQTGRNDASYEHGPNDFLIQPEKFRENLEVCRDNGIPFLDVGLLNNKDFYDGLHPNSEGHRKIFEKVKNFLQKKRWI